MLAQQLINGLVVGNIYALFALGFTLIFGVNHIMNMAYGAVFMVGAFAGLAAVQFIGSSFVLALIAGALGGGIVSVVLDWVAFRPLRRRRANEFAAIVSSIGAGFVLMSLAQQMTNTKVMRYPFDIFPAMPLTFMGVRITLLQLSIIVLVAVLIAGLLFLLYRTSFGRQVRAVAVAENTSKLLGVNTGRVHFSVFFLSGALAGIAGVLIGIVFNSVHFMMGEPFLLRAFVVIILGGLGSIPGALVAGILIGVMQTLTVAYFSAGAADVVVFTALFLILLFKPNGLFGDVSLVSRTARQ